MTEKLSVRVPPELAKALQAREAETMVPTSRFVRKLIEQALAKKAEK